MESFAPGDVVEIETGGGLAYVHITHDHPSYPQAVRGFRRSRANPAGDLEALVAGPADFVALVPLREVLGRLKLRARIAGRVKPRGDAFPTFRMAVRDRAGAVLYWWYWDGAGLTYSDGDTETSDAPDREVLSAERFLDLLSSTARAASPRPIKEAE